MDAAERKILHFNLTFQSRLEGKVTSRGAGAIDLCEPCWREATGRSKIHARPARRTA